jgi:hypothetical protein
MESLVKRMIKSEIEDFELVFYFISQFVIYFPYSAKQKQKSAVEM